MRNSYDYIEVRLAEQRAAAENRRRIAAARSQRGSGDRFGGLWRRRQPRADGLGGCVD